MATDELRFLHECGVLPPTSKPKEGVKEQQNPFINDSKAAVNSHQYETFIVWQTSYYLTCNILFITHNNPVS